MSHRHANDPKTCVEVGPTVCLTPTTHGYLIHFDPPFAGDVRQMGSVVVAPGAWKQSGTLEGGDLTLEPSIHVSDPDGDRLHGFVRNGAWVPAG